MKIYCVSFNYLPFAEECSRGGDAGTSITASSRRRRRQEEEETQQFT